jgi:hypothetical protein
MNNYTDWLDPEEPCDESDRTENPTTECAWCDSTGTYSGMFAGRHYAGPCLICQ